jgi:hypothetical protein
MRTLLVVLVLLVAGIAGLGFYRGWFSLASDSVDAQSNITLTVDTDKIQEDKKTAIANAQDFGHQMEDKAAAATEKRIDGSVVSVSGDKLALTNKEGKEHRYTLDADVKVTCDGNVCEAADLKPGMRIRVTTKRVDPQAASRVEALDKNRDFEKADGNAVTQPVQ